MSRFRHDWFFTSRGALKHQMTGSFDMMVFFLLSCQDWDWRELDWSSAACRPTTQQHSHSMYTHRVEQQLRYNKLMLTSNGLIELNGCVNTYDTVLNHVFAHFFFSWCQILALKMSPSPGLQWTSTARLALHYHMTLFPRLSSLLTTISLMVTTDIKKCLVPSTPIPHQGRQSLARWVTRHRWGSQCL